MTEQIAVKLPAPVLEKMDRVIARGRFASRSDLVRRGIDVVLAAVQRQDVDQEYAEAYAAVPESDGELADARRLALEAIADEPWEPWW